KKIYETTDLDSHNIYRDNPICKIAKKLQKDISVRKEDYEKLFGSDFFDVNMIIDGIVVYHASDDDITYLNIREKQILKNFKSVYEHYPKGKYYGQWGCAHIPLTQGVSNIKNNFASVLNTSYSELKGKIFSIGYVYSSPNSEKYKEFIKPFSPYLDKNKSFTIFKTYGKDCPFDVPAYGFFSNPITDNNTLSDYFKAIIIIQNYKCEEWYF
ncbi:hypothetical protein, partial [Clostridium tepidiprofundi]